MLSAISINWVALIAAIVISMVIGSVIYSPPVLGNWWMKEIGRAPRNLSREEMMRVMGTAVALSILMGVCFAILFGWTGASGAGEGAAVGILLGLGFGVPIGMVHATFEEKPMMVGMVYGAHHIIEYTIIGIVFGLLS